MSDRRSRGRGNEEEEFREAVRSVATGIRDMFAMGQQIYNAFNGGSSEQSGVYQQRESRNHELGNESPYSSLYRQESRSLSYFDDPTPSSLSSSWLLSAAPASTENTIIIAVDATPTRAGGLLLLPKSKKIYFYSIRWADVFNFPNEPDKFEMVNALLSMEIFKTYVSHYKRMHTGPFTLCVKTDSSYCTSTSPSGPYPGLDNGEYRALFQNIKAKLSAEPFGGSWKYTRKSTGDKHIKMADRLSRADCSDLVALPQLPNDGDPFPEYYFNENVSRKDYDKIHHVARQVPAEWQRGSQQQGEVDGWKVLAGVVGGALIAGAAGYGMYSYMQSGKEENSQRSSTVLQSDDDGDEPRGSSYYSNSSHAQLGAARVTSIYGEDEPIIIAVDATEQRAGGLMILPNCKEIYFYSIYWADIFVFPQPDKFEMVNALLALEIFEDYVRDYRKNPRNSVDSLIVKTDSTFCTSRLARGAYPGQGNQEYRSLERSINAKLEAEPFAGQWKYVGGKVDNHMKMADKLRHTIFSIVK